MMKACREIHLKFSITITTECSGGAEHENSMH